MVCAFIKAMPFNTSAGPTATPLVGIVSNLLITDSGPFPGMERSYVNHDYVSSLERSGAVPLMLPVIADPAAIRRQVAAVDGLVFSGGYDPNPLLYGENPSRRIEFIFPEVDEYQLAVVHAADELRKPILGICRGLQILNIAFGGTLYQDLSLIPNSYIQHVQKSRRDAKSHQVTVVKDTILAGIINENTILTNSFHHLAIKDLAPGFAVNALAADGVIEGFERRGDVPILAVQWHPEMMYEKHQEMRGIFDAFVRMMEPR
jgi:putative glutamine amidotransferase